MTAPEWIYKDARGVEHRGYVTGTTDFGGTDVVYRFRDAETGELSCVRGLLLKEARTTGNVVKVIR